MTTEDRIERALGVRPVSVRPLPGGCVADARLAQLPGGERVVVKIDLSGRSGLGLEGWMLDTLRERAAAPTPRVLHASDQLLIMEFVEGRSEFGPEAQRDCAERFAAIHDATWTSFGLERDTVIGGLPQPNPPTERWVEFFARHRLAHMALEAERAGGIPSTLRRRVESLTNRLDRLLLEPDRPSLIHGDAWSGNILTRGGKLVALIDPSIHYAHPEVELAFTTLFGTFGEPFFQRYHEIRPIADGFFEQRRDIYNLYPLLVHARLFGGSYGASVDSTLRRLGV